MTGMLTAGIAVGPGIFRQFGDDKPRITNSFRDFSLLSHDEKSQILTRLMTMTNQPLSLRMEELQALIIKDFELEQVYLLEGWVVAETELAFALLEKRLPLP